MNEISSQKLIAEEIIISKIYNVRGKQVILNQQVKRNIGKFPERYMFQLTKDEHDRLRSQNVTLKRGQYIKYLPYAFTEHGILMLSSVLRSRRAEKIIILIIDTFVKIRELILAGAGFLQHLQNKARKSQLSYN